MMIQPDSENNIFTIAARFINNSNHPVFLTGKAGTGKTTFLKYIRENCSKNAAVVAPTGVAAINAGGTTIHSFFQLPFSPYIPARKKQAGSIEFNDKHHLAEKLRLTTERKEIIQKLELLVIDEISMVRCDVLDAIDNVLRFVRGIFSKPFGGVQVLYIGDMYQLPPVIKEDEWRILKEFYKDPYFFSSKVVEEQPPVYIELEKVYRQKDFSFIQLLNKVRNNEMDEEGYELLHSRYDPSFEPGEKDDYITLTTHNQKADIINSDALQKINAPIHSFKAIVEGVFPESAYPADEILNLKAGAKVMFIKNDLEKIRRYYNGKIGFIHKMDDHKIWVECMQDNNSTMIEVTREPWQNIKYQINPKTKQIEEEVLGSFTQFPLRLAWAITIHKSQGLTFEKAVIDAGRAFASGQVYVALSRCTNLQGLVLKSKIPYQALQSDELVVAFTQKQKKEQEKENILSVAQKEYQQEIIRRLFDFSSLEKNTRGLLQWDEEHHVFGDAIFNWLQQLMLQVNVFNAHGTKFLAVLQDFFREDVFPEENESLRERLQKASHWFIHELGKTILHVESSAASTDNRQKAHEFTTRLAVIYELLIQQTHMLQCCLEAFSVTAYQQQQRSFQKKKFNINAYAGGSENISKEISHPNLFIELRNRRNQLAEEKGCPVYLICSTESLEMMAKFFPLTIKDLTKIPGFGIIKAQQFGEIFTEIIRAYCAENDIESDCALLPVKKKAKIKSAAVKTDSKQETFHLFSQGKTITEIASARNLAATTIEGHLAYFIETGTIHINQLVNKEKQRQIREVFVSKEFKGLKEIKAALPEEFDYAAIKWMLASEKFSAASEKL